MIRNRVALCLIVVTALLCHFSAPLAKPKRSYKIKQRSNWGGFSQDGKILWTSSSESTYVRRSKDGKALFEIPEPISYLKFLHGDRFLVHRPKNGGYQILNRKGKVVTDKLQGVPLRITADGKFILTQRRVDSGRQPREFRLLSAKNGAEQWTTKLRSKAASCDISPDGKVIALGIDDHNSGKSAFTLINAKSGKIIQENLKSERIGELKFSPDGRYIATKWRANRSDRYVDIFDLKTRKVVAILGKDLPVGAPVWSGDGKFLGLTNHRRPASVQLYSTGDWQPHLEAFPHFRPWRFQFSGDGSLFLTWEWDKDFKNSTGILRSSEDGSELAKMTLSDAGYFHLSNDGAIAVEAAGRVAERPQVDLLARQDESWTQHKLRGPLRTAELGPDGRKLLVFHGPEGATVWDLRKVADKQNWTDVLQSVLEEL